MAENGLEASSDAYCAATELATLINTGADVLDVLNAYGKLNEAMQGLMGILLEERSQRRYQ